MIHCKKCDRIHALYHDCNQDGFKIYFYDLYNTILKDGYFTIYDLFEIKYAAPLIERVDLAHNILLLLQDSEGNNVPIDTIPIDNLGFFDYGERLSLDSPLSIPLGGGKRIVHMELAYLPLNIYNKSSDMLEDVIYDDVDVGKIYNCKESNRWAKPITVITIPDQVKLTMNEDPSQNMFTSQKFYEEREYFYNLNPVEALEKGEEYTRVSIETFVNENYTYSFKMTNEENKPVKDRVVWLHIGLMPKSKSQFLNDRVRFDDTDLPVYFESLGTEEITSIGPGTGANKMFSKPVTYELDSYNTELNAYGPYVWTYGVTDEFGDVSFDVSFDYDYLKDFTDIFGSMEGINSVEDIVLYVRAFSSNFNWTEFAIDTPELYVCSKDGLIFDGSTITEDYDSTNLAIQDSTYAEGLIYLHKRPIALGVNDYFSYNLPDTEITSSYDPITMYLYATEANPIPTSAAISRDMMTKDYTSSELEPTDVNIFNDTYFYYADIDFYTPNGTHVETLFMQVQESLNGGYITIDNETVVQLLSELGPGISTIAIQIAESEYYRASPVVSVPLEIRPANWISFGQKNSIIDLVDPFVSAWGSAYNNEVEMPFESNYPHLIGAVWIEPYFNSTGSELSVQDYIDISLDCTIYYEDGTTSTFPLVDSIMLRPGNNDGVMTFKESLGPEGHFLMGMQCDLNFSFNIDFNKDVIFEEQRDVTIKLLDLRLEANPSSNAPNTTWSIYDNQFSSDDIAVLKTDDTITPEFGTVNLGGTMGGEIYGQEIAFLFYNDTLEYGIEEGSELLDLLALSDVEVKKVIGIKDGSEFEFEYGVDWNTPYYPTSVLHNASVIEFIGTNRPDEMTEFSVVYELELSYGSNHYGQITLGYSNGYNESSIKLQLPSGFLPDSDDSRSPMYTRFSDSISGDDSTIIFTLSYGLNGVTTWNDNFIIYNKEEIEDEFGAFSEDVDGNNHPYLMFSAPPPSSKIVNISYGVKSQYDLSYGFQKLNESYSDSVRLMHNQESSPVIIDSLDNQLDAYTLDESSLYISLGDSEEETTIKLHNVPLLFAPEINLTMKFDEILLDVIDEFDSDFNDLTIEFTYITNDGYYEFYSDPLVIPLNYSEILLDVVDEVYTISYGKDLQAIYDAVGSSSVDIEISFSQAGDSLNYIPYLILEQFDYLSDEHIVEMYDRSPIDKYGETDMSALINTPHYYQVFSNDFLLEPFNFMEGSQITVALKDLPNSTLVSLGKGEGNDYSFTYWGDSKTLDVSAENYYRIPNLGMYVDAYDIEEPLYQDGYLDLYYGSGTQIDGEQYYNTAIAMDYSGSAINNYYSDISGLTPTSWENTFDFTDQFLTTQEISVSGEAFYHQVFDLDTDVNNSATMNNMFSDYDDYIYFGLQLPDNFDISRIKTVGMPYSYALSVQGFPIGNYKDQYCSVETSSSGAYAPSPTQLRLTVGEDFALEYNENYTAYILFFKPAGDLGIYTDVENKIMVDYWVNTEFTPNSDYIIRETPENPYNSQIEWDFGFTDVGDYLLHPDFSIDTSFNIEYYALEWEIFNQDYVKDGEDSFTFRPYEYYNISVLYTGEDNTDTISTQYIVSDDQYAEDYIVFPKIYALMQQGTDEETMTVVTIYNALPYNYLAQEAPDSFNYIIDFTEIDSYIQTYYSGYSLVENSFVYVEAKYNSSSLRYQMNHTPFNYDYLGDNDDDYVISLYVDSQFVAYSNESLFNDYVLKIENNYAYFQNKSDQESGYIEPNTNVELKYKYKLQPGLIDRKHFIMVTYPWTNLFETTLDSLNNYREKYRKLSGGSIITPFEYSLSIDNIYNLYLSYRLNSKDYYEENFEIKSEHYRSSVSGYVYEIMSPELDNYIDIIEADGEEAVSVFYFNSRGKMIFLDAVHYSVDIGAREITIKNDGNGLVSSIQTNKEFFVSFVTDNADKELSNYRFSYDSTEGITSMLNVTSWSIVDAEDFNIIPNLDAPYFINEDATTSQSVICQASQVAVYLKQGDQLEFNISQELQYYNQDLLAEIQNGDYLALYLDTNIKNIESLKYITIELFDSSGLMSQLTQVITAKELIMVDHDLKVNLPTNPNSLKTIKFTPEFRNDAEFSSDNAKGIIRIQTVEWNSELVSVMEDGVERMQIELESDLIVKGVELAYVFNNVLEHLTFSNSVNYTLENDIYTLHIPTVYFNNNTSETGRFKDGQLIVVKYSSPVKKGIAVGIGKTYFENKGYNYDSHPDLPKAELLLINANSTSSYSEFTDDYYYQVPLEITPFDTEFNGRVKAIKIELNLTSLFASEGVEELDFSNIVISVSNPTYELTISEIALLEQSYKTSNEYGSSDSRVWQYSEFEMFSSDSDPEDDSYQLTLDSIPMFYPDTTWLDYLTIYDEEGNYYSAGITGNDHQLHFEPATDTFTWNPSFNQYPEPLIIEPNSTLFLEFATNISWTEAIRIDEQNIDLDSIRAVYDYNYLLKPEHYDWLSQFGTSHSYENIAYSFKEESEYRVVQYYYETFSVYTEISEYNHTFDLDGLTFENDFVNLSLYQVIGVTPTFDTVILTNNANFSLDFDKISNNLTITDLNSTDGLLDVFDQITAIVNYSYAPISSYTEIFLLENFNKTYLSDQTETFYSLVEIDYNFKSESGIRLFAEGSDTITSESTSFVSIDFSRNGDISAENRFIGYNSEKFDNFEVYYDDSSIIYVADIDMDGESDYKQTIDVDGDGVPNIIKYGIDDPEGSDEIYWHTVIQNFENQEIKVSSNLEEELRTEWFDIDDQTFAYYDFNVVKLLISILALPLMLVTLSKMMLPDVDYWAQKSTQRQVDKEERSKTNFYSVQVDEDRDGTVDEATNFETTEVSIYYEVTEFKKTILAAKLQNVLTFLGEYIMKSVASLFGSKDDFVFNEFLTEEHLDSNDFSTANLGAIMNAPTLSATYRKFTENITTSYVDTAEESTLTFLDYYEGEIEEQRVYRDDFKNNEVESVEGFFEDVSNQHLVTNIDTHSQTEMLFDPEIPHASPANISWTGLTWSSDNVPVKYDSLQVIDENNQVTHSTNYFEKNIILRIPNRYSLYNDFGKISKSSVEDDGWVEFEVTGAMVTPVDGQVYYTSDIETFTDGSAKTSGSYFFVDSDQNGYFETVYIVSNIYTVSRLGVPKYDVISIGLNYDGIHDFAPYEKLDHVENTITDFSNLAKGSRMFGSDWVYNFDNLKSNDLLFEILNEEDKFWKEYKTKDQIFEIYKTSKNSEENPKFTELFYEIRHKSYARAWDAYKKQLIGDIAEQVFMSLTAAFASAAVEAIITAATIGLGWLGAKGAAILTYIGVYTLMTKFSIDRKLHVAEAKERSEKFYPSSSGPQEPTSLNEKNLYDRILQDTMAAAIIGHPGGYYTTVRGEDSGTTYTGQLLVSPPNPLRLSIGFLTDGFYELLIENFVNMGGSDPDAYTALDFDDVNLDYLLMTSELPYYNTKEFYTYLNTEFLFNDYNLHSYNTLGALETIVMEQSSGSFDTIKPNNIAGTPNYEFVDSSAQEAILPISTLYRPVVLSQARFDQLQPSLGQLMVTVQCKDYEDTVGINAYNLDDIESTIFEAKVPLNDNGFEYPITRVSIDVVLLGTFESRYFAQDILIEEDYYITFDGNLYFTESIETIVSESYPNFETFLAESWASELTDDTIFYNIQIEFERFIPDTNDETNRLALAQATSYSIMDYFNQYTFAEVSANMISEITYTETLTFWSTLISAPLAYFGSWAITAGIGKLAGEAGSKLVTQLLVDQQKSILGGLLGTVVSPIKEVFQEIVEDGFIEAIVGNLVDIAGGSEDLGFWLSSIATSVRESGGALGQLALGGAVNLKSIGTLIKGRATGMSMTEVRQQISQQFEQRQDARQQASEQRGFWSKLLRGGFLKGMVMVTSSVFFGTFGFGALSGLKRMTSGVIKASPSRQAIIESIQHNRRKKVIKNQVGTEADFSKDVMFTDRVTKPSELDGVNLDLSEDNELTSPFVDILSSINSDPKKIQSKQELANKFEEFRNNNFFETTSRIENQVGAVQDVDKRPVTSDLEVSIGIGDYNGLFPELGEDLIHHIYSKLFDPDYDLNNPERGNNRLIYDQELFNEAREFLKTTTYQGLEIVLEGGINWKVFEILRVKFNNGEKLSKLERIISDVAVFYMGGYYAREVPRNEKFEKMDGIIDKQISEYLKTGGKRLLSISEASQEAGVSKNTGVKYAHLILNELYGESKGKIMYKLMFGKLTNSYHKMQFESADNNFRLVTTHEEWINLLMTRGNTRPSRLHVLLECTKGHTFPRMVEFLKNDIGCVTCRHDSLRMTFDHAVKTANAKGFEVLSSEKEFNAAYENAISRGFTGSYVELVYQHKECGHSFKNTHYNLITRGSTAISCPKCGQFKNEKMTHSMAEFIFKQAFDVGKGLTKIFPELRTSSEYSDIGKTMSFSHMHIDMSSELNIKDKNSNRINLGIEYQGEQHDDSAEGLRAYLRLSRFKGVEGDAEWVRLKKEWRLMLLRDQFKVDLYNSKSSDGYYLIRVPHTIKPNARIPFIINEFFKLTNIRIKVSDSIDWKKFLL